MGPLSRSSGSAARNSRGGSGVNTDPNFIVDTLEEFIRAFMVAISRQLIVNLRVRTPKDTEFASVNWIANIGSPYPSTAGLKADARKGRINQEPQRQSWASLVSYQLQDGRIYITNNVSYIVDLNRGYSKQEPNPNWIQQEMEITMLQVLQNPAAIRTFL